MNYYLTQDVTGPYSCRLYGKRGDKVRLISVHQDMAIVEAVERFGVKIELLSTGPPGIESTIPIPLKTEPTPPTRRKATKQRVTVTNKLF